MRETSIDALKSRLTGRKQEEGGEWAGEEGDARNFIRGEGGPRELDAINGQGT